MPADKVRIAQEAFAPNAVVKRVGERHEIGTGLLFTWRRQLIPARPASFLPVHLMPAESDAPMPSPPPSGQPGLIQVDMPSGTRIRGGRGADVKVLLAVLAALDGC